MKCEKCGTEFIQHKTGPRVRVCKSCRSVEYNRRKPEYNRRKQLRRTQRRRAGDPTALLRERRHRAKKRGIEFTLTADTLPPIPAVCPVFGLPFGGRIGPPSLDRVDSSNGYSPGNVRWVSFRANTIKSDATAAELIAIANYMLKHELMS